MIELEVDDQILDRELRVEGFERVFNIYRGS